MRKEWRTQDSRPDGADWTNFERPYVLAVEDPKDPTNDICRHAGQGVCGGAGAVVKRTNGTGWGGWQG